MNYVFNEVFGTHLETRNVLGCLAVLQSPIIPFRTWLSLVDTVGVYVFFMFTDVSESLCLIVYVTIALTLSLSFCVCVLFLVY